MKTSKILLLTLTIIPILFVASIPVTLKWKLNHSDFTIANPQDDFVYHSHKFSQIKFIFLKGVDCVIIPSDSIQIDIENNKANPLELMQSNDTLTVKLKNQNKLLPKIRLYLTSMEKIIVDNSKILLRGQLEPMEAKSYNFYISHSSFQTTNISKDAKVSQFLDKVSIRGSNSTIDLSGSMRIEKLSIIDIEHVEFSPQVGIEEMEIIFNEKLQVRSVGKDGVTKIVAN